MEEKKDSNDQPLDKSKYNDFSDDGIKLYMYEEKIGKSHNFVKKEEENGGGNNGDGKELTG